MRGKPASSPRRASQRSSSPSVSARSAESSPPSERGLYVMRTAGAASLRRRRRLVDRPGADAGHFARVLGQVAVGVDGALARAEHADEDAQRLGMGDPVPAVANRVPPEQGRDGAKRPLRGELADPARLVVDGAGVDAGRRQQLRGRALAALGPHAKEVRLEDRGSELLLARLAARCPEELGRWRASLPRRTPAFPPWRKSQWTAQSDEPTARRRRSQGATTGLM